MDNLLHLGTRLVRPGFAASVLALTCLIVSMGAFAQSISPISSALAGTATGCTHVATPDSAGTDVDQFRRLTADEQAASLRKRIENHSLLSLSDTQILCLMDAMKPEAFVEYARSDMVLDNAYEYSMFRQERVSGRWFDRPDHMMIRYQDNPRKSTQNGCLTAAMQDRKFCMTKQRTPIASMATRVVCCVSCQARSQWMVRSRTRSPAIACAILACSSSRAPSITTLEALMKRA